MAYMLTAQQSGVEAPASYVVTEMNGAHTGTMVMLILPGARRLLGRPVGGVGDRLTNPADVHGLESVQEITRRHSSQDRRLSLSDASPGQTMLRIALVMNRDANREGR
jgi:hypothetical protein